MSDLPQYEYMVSPATQRGGPTGLQIAGLFGAEQERVRIVGSTISRITGAAADVARVIIEQTVRLQEAYDLAQLNKAKAGYYALMREFTEGLPDSDVPVGEWQEEYSRRSDEAAEEALRLMEDTTARYPLSPQGQSITRDAFQAWRTTQDADFSSLVLQNQRAKMTDQVTAQIRLDMQMVRNNPGYLPTFLENVRDSVRRNIISADYGSKIIDQAKQIAGIAAVYEYAKSLGPDAGATWLADDANLTDVSAELLPTGLDSLALDEQSRDRLRSDFSLWAGQVMADAERAKRSLVDTANREFIDRFYSGKVTVEPDGTTTTMWLTIEDLRTDPRLLHDPNTPQANAYADGTYEHWASMIRARNEAARSGLKDPNTLDNEELRLNIMRMIYSPVYKRQFVYDYIDQHIGVDEAGNPRLSGDTTKELHSLLEQYKPTGAADAGFGIIERSTGPLGLFSPSEGTQAQQSLANQIADAQIAGKPMTEEEIAQAADNLVKMQQMKRFKQEFSDPKKAPPEIQERYEIWKEAQETRYYQRMGRGLLGAGRGVRNLEAFVLSVQKGWVTGLTDTPEYQEMTAAAQPVMDEAFKDWTGLTPGQRGDGYQRRQESVQIFDGHILYLVDIFSFRDPSRKTTVALTMHYDEASDQLVWAKYDPATRAVLPYFQNGRQLPFYQVLDIERDVWARQLGRGEQ